MQQAQQPQAPTRQEPREPAKRHTAPEIGFLSGASVETAFVVLLYVVLVALVVLSILGTFYGRLGMDAPITAPLLIMKHIKAVPAQLGIAILIQLVLTVAQYGARQRAKRDRRWWFLYLAALGVSVYYNFQAYWGPLGALVPSYAAAGLIIAGDVLPEFLAVKHEKKR